MLAGLRGRRAGLFRRPVGIDDSARTEDSPKGGAASVTLGQGTLIILIVQIAATGTRYVAQVLLARSGGPKQFGYFSFAYAWVNLLVAPVALGFTMCVLRFIPGYIEARQWREVRGLLRRSTQFMFLAAATVAAIAIPVTLVSSGDHERTVTLVLAFATLPTVAAVNLQKQFARASKNVLAAYGAGELFPPLVAVVLTGVLIGTGVRLSGGGMMVATTVGFAAVLPIQWVLLRRMLPRAFDDKPVFDTRVWLSVAGPLLVLVVISGAMNFADTIIVGFLRSPAQTGVYAAANRGANMVSFVLAAVNGILAPLVVSAHRSGDRERLQRLLQSAVKWGFFGSLVIAVPLLVGAVPFLAIFGKGFSGGATALRILAVAQLINAAAGPVGLALPMTGHHTVVAWVSVFSFAVGLVLYLVLIPMFGIVGAAIGSASTTTIWNAWLYIETRKRLRVKLYGFI